MTAPSLRTHPRARGFDRVAEQYERGRPGYAPAAVAFLARTLRLRPGRTVVELGSGTGKFSRALRPTGTALVAIEPVAGMRAVFRRVVPEVAVVPGTAEAIPLPDGFADVVVAAQSFHWFRGSAAVGEIARVLRPGGALALVWNVRNQRFRFWRDVNRILRRYRWGSRTAGERRWRAPFERPGSPFGPLHERHFPHLQTLTPRGVIERVLSVSDLAMRSRKDRAAVARELRRLLATDPVLRGSRTLALPYTTEVFWTRRD
jgi:SAM-dependent methyltransferase